MEAIFHTLHNFLFFTKGTAYVIMGIMLIAYLGFWAFLFGRDED